MTGFQHCIPKSFYVYVHRRKTDGGVFYVGKGSGDRAWKQWARSKYWRNIVAKHGYTVEIVQDGMQEWWAFELERELIAYYGRETLCNLTDGGDGTSGRIVGENEKQLKRALFTGRPLLEETKRKISEAAMGRSISDEAKKKISLAQKGKIVSDATRQKISANNAMRHNPEARRKLSKAKKGKKNPHIAGALNHMHRPEMKALVSARCKGIARPDMKGSKNPSARAVVCVETGQVFATQLDARNWLVSIGKPDSTQASNICSAASGKLKTAYGFRWKYADK